MPTNWGMYGRRTTEDDSFNRDAAGFERHAAQIAAVILQQIEGVERGYVTATPAAQHLEIGETIRPDHDRLAVEREALGFQPSCALCDRRQSRRPIDCLATKKPNALAVAADDDPISVMLDFVNPVGAGSPLAGLFRARCLWGFRL
jgi:hypothetical protein